MKKILLMAFSFLMVFGLAGCHTINELENAGAKLEEENYTAYIEMELGVNLNDEELESQKIEYLLKQNKDQVLVSTWDEEGVRYDAYAEVVENEVSLYTKEGKYWYFVGAQTLGEFENTETVNIPEVELTKENFTYEKGMWVGNTENINKELEKYFEEILTAYETMPGFEDAEIVTTVEKYNVVLDVNTISEVEFDFNISITIDGEELLIMETMTIEYSEVGSTIVTKPENIFTISDAVLEDNYTGDLDLSITMTMNGSNINDSESTDVQFTIYQDGDKAHIIGSAEGEEIEIYTELDGDVVNLYVNEYGEWTLVPSGDVELDTMTSVPEVELTTENFDYVDGVWVGNCEKITGLLGEYLDEVLGMYGFEELGAEVDSQITKYNIITTEQYVTEIQYEFVITISYYGETLEIKQAMTLTMSELGTTIVERPEIE